jgi:hypothetical protein
VLSKGRLNAKCECRQFLNYNIADSSDLPFAAVEALLTARADKEPQKQRGASGDQRVQPGRRRDPPDRYVAEPATAAGFS